jgi:RNA polymerase sigma factor (sigma-70 family)
VTNSTPPTRDELIAAFLPKVRIISRTFSHARLDRDDLYSEGLIGLVKAVDSWNPRRSALSTWVEHKVRSRIMDFLRREDILTRSQRRLVKATGEWNPLQETWDEFSTALPRDPGPSPEEMAQASLTRRALLRGIDTLPECSVRPDIQAVLTKLFFEDRSIDQVVTETGFSQDKVFRMRSQGLGQLSRKTEIRAERAA